MGTAGETGIQLWNYKDGIASLIQEIPVPGPVRAAALSPDGRELVVATAYSENPDFSYNVTIWSLPSGEYDRLFEKTFLVGMTPRLSYSPDSELLVVSECEGFLYIVSDGTFLERLNSFGFKWTYNCISDVVFSPEGDVLYYAGNKKLVEWKVPIY